MLGNCEKMVVIPSTTNEWPQNQMIDDQKGLMDSAGRMMEKPSQDHQQQQQVQQPLKCPRCDSSNTKFCYYNNYSLSQPRHFCKSCKRYWTRGGTLRNVPVGGGCRKNKRVKRPASAGEITSSSASTATANPSVQPHIDLSSTGSHINPLFYSLLSSNPSELDIPYPRFSSRVSNIDTISGYDLQPPMNGIGLGFSSGLLASDVHSNGFNSNKQIQDVLSSNSLLSNYNPIFGSTSTSNTSTMASLIASSLQQQKLISGGFKEAQAVKSFQGFGAFEDVQIPRNGDGGHMVKDVKMEESQDRLDWNVPYQNHIEQINSSDPSLLWNTSAAGAWLDPSNIGSSVPSLI